MCKWGRAEQLHIIFRALMQFTANNGGQLPRLNNEEDAAKVCQFAKTLVSKKGLDLKDVIKLEEVDAKLAMNVARYARAQICPMASFMGGVVAQEVVKFTGKFTPLNQWFHCEWFEALPEGDIDRTFANDRYCDFVAIFGNEVAKKMRQGKYFLVGCGALGCEYIKMLAMMGVGCSKEGLVTCTDDD